MVGKDVEMVFEFSNSEIISVFIALANNENPWRYFATSLCVYFPFQGSYILEWKRSR